MIARKKAAAIAQRTKRGAKVNAEIAANVAAISNKVNARSNVVMTARKKAAVRKNAEIAAKTSKMAAIRVVKKTAMSKKKVARKIVVKTVHALIVRK